MSYHSLVPVLAAYPPPKAPGQSSAHFVQYQKLAVAQENHAEGKRVFSCHYPDAAQSKSGARFYIVADLDEFWAMYKDLNSKERYYYEIIESDSPCRLHFDLEFERIHDNQHLSDEAVYENFVQSTVAVLKEHGIEINPDKDIVALDSSSDSKFSCHAIVHTDHLFPNNLSLAPLVKCVERKILRTATFKVFDKNGQETTIIDPSIYNKNRNFRLFLSTKPGKDSWLILSRSCHRYKDRFHLTRQDIFLDSLVVPPNAASFSIFDLSAHNLLHSEANSLQNSFLNSEPNSSQGIQLDREMNAAVPLRPSIFSSRSIPQAPFDGRLVYIGAIKHQYFFRQVTFSLPTFDNTVTQLLRYYGMNSDFRKCSLVYDPVNYTEFIGIDYMPREFRWCFNINREHARNHTTWTFYFNSGIFFQSCFDAKCHGREMINFSIPRHLYRLACLQLPPGYRWKQLIAPAYTNALEAMKNLNPQLDEGKTEEKLRNEIEAEWKEFLKEWEKFAEYAMRGIHLELTKHANV